MTSIVVKEINGYGPYKYRVTNENGEQHWEYLGRADGKGAYDVRDADSSESGSATESVYPDDWDEVSGVLKETTERFVDDHPEVVERVLFTGGQIKTIAEVDGERFKIRYEDAGNAGVKVHTVKDGGGVVGSSILSDMDDAVESVEASVNDAKQKLAVKEAGRTGADIKVDGVIRDDGGSRRFALDSPYESKGDIKSIEGAEYDASRTKEAGEEEWSIPAENREEAVEKLEEAGWEVFVPDVEYME